MSLTPEVPNRREASRAPRLEAGPGGTKKKYSLTSPVSVKANYNITCQTVTKVVHGGGDQNVYIIRSGT